MRESFARPIRYVASFLLVLSVALGLLCGMVRTARADDAPAVGTVWLVDETFELSDGIWFYRGTADSTKYKSASTSNTLGFIFDEQKSQWCSTYNYSVTDSTSEMTLVNLVFNLPAGKTQAEEPAGIIVHGGTGTEEDPIQLGLVYDWDIISVSLDKNTASLYVDDVVDLNATVKVVERVDVPGEADKTVKWSVIEGGDKVKLFSDANCKTEVGSDATDVTTVYAKGLAAGNAKVKVESNADSTKFATCDVAVSAKTYAVSVVCAGLDGATGTASANPTSGPQGTVVTLSATPGEDCEFVGWELVSGDGAKLEDNKVTIGTSDVKVFAKFKKIEPATYKITVTPEPPEGGTAEADAEDAEPGDTVTLTATPKEGYEFAGWSTQTKGVEIVDDTFEMPASDVKITANFEEKETPDETATLTFNLAGGTLNGKTGTITKTAIIGETIKLPSAPTRKGYTFMYWKGSKYKAGAEYKVEGDHTFTAVWKKNATPTTTYSITFDANGGTGSMAKLTAEAGTMVTLTANKFTKSGYAFVGWNTQANGGGTSYEDGDEVELNANMTLYAQWEKRDYPSPTMSNNHGGAFTSTTDEITYTVMQEVPVYATSLRTWVDLESVLSFTSTDVTVQTTDGTTVGSDVARVSIVGRRINVTVNDATSLRGKTLKFSYRAKINTGANLSSFANADGSIASVPYQAHTVFDGNENDVKHSTVEYVKFRVSKSSTASTSTTTRYSTAAARTLAKTGDATSLVSVAMMAIAGVGFALAGAKRR